MSLQQALKKYELDGAAVNAEDAAIDLSCVTLRPIAVTDLHWWLSGEKTGLAERDAITGAMTGLLPDMVISSLVDPQTAGGIRRLLNHAFRPGSAFLDTTIISVAKEACYLIDNLRIAGIVSDDVAAGFFELGGGRPHLDVTAEQVQQAREAIQSAELKRVEFQMCNEWINGLHGLLHGLYDNPNVTAGEMVNGVTDLMRAYVQAADDNGD